MQFILALICKDFTPIPLDVGLGEHSSNLQDKLFGSTEGGIHGYIVPCVGMMGDDNVRPHYVEDRSIVVSLVFGVHAPIPSVC